jgi:hypothetical protein
MLKWLGVLFVVAILGSCVLPGREGWECNDEGDCKSGLSCQSMHDSSGYTSLCMDPGDNVYAGTKGNWLRLMIWPLGGIAVAIAVASRVVAARRRRREAGTPPR